MTTAQRVCSRAENSAIVAVVKHLGLISMSAYIKKLIKKIVFRVLLCAGVKLPASFSPTPAL